MKSNQKTRQAADFVDVRRNGEGVTYKCLKCGLEMESNVYYEPTYKSMLSHAANCEGTMNANADRQLIISPPQQEWRAVQVYDETMVQQLAARIKSCVPNGNRLQDNEALALAQIAISIDLNPFIGEVWYIPGRGPCIGIEGLRRKSEEQSTSSLHFRKMTNEEITEHSIGQHDVGRICELFRHDILREAVEINKAAGEAVIPIEPIKGVGIWKKGDPVPKGKSPAWVAEKRAEADARRKAFNIIMPFYSNGEWLSVADEDGIEVVEVETVRRQVAINAERVARADVAENLGDVITAYKTGQRQLPAWAEELRQTISKDPKTSDPIGADWIKRLRLAAEEEVTRARFEAFIQIVLGHLVEEMTFGEVRVVKSLVNNNSFADKVAELLA